MGQPAAPAHLLVLGAGAWGTALAIHASRQTSTPVRLWARDPHQAQDMLAAKSNQRYLPGQKFPANLEIVHGAIEAFLPQASGLVLIATPMAALREMLQRLSDYPGTAAWLAKGFEAGTGLLGHEILAEVAPALQAGVFSGPSFAQEVAAGLPAAIVVASPYRAVRTEVVQAFHSSTLRVYESEDMVGVEVGGAVKNVLAIATGLCDGLGLGLNARAALITRGLAEMTRLSLALGGKMESSMGLTGLGDLVLTATGDLSRNRKVGLLLAEGKSLADITAQLGHVAEGVYSAQTVVARAESLGVEMPISACVLAVLNDKLKPREAVAMLMERQVKPEGGQP